MITAKELHYIKTYAYIPEHMPEYVAGISGAEPYLVKTFLCYKKMGALIFIGYPLDNQFEEKKMKKILDRAIREFEPEEIALIAPSIKILSNVACREKTSDAYYRLDLSKIDIPQKVKNMINRASRELNTETDRKCSGGHLMLIAEFLESHKIDEHTRYIFDKIPAYVSSSETALVINARDRRGRLIAFDVAEFDSKNYAFYMFNFASRKYYVPGASDLLLQELIRLAQDKGKKSLNLGLGINKGVSFFKAKWGGTPFLPYEFCQYKNIGKTTMETLLDKL